MPNPFFESRFNIKSPMDFLRGEIVSMAKSEEDAQAITQKIIQEFAETNWGLLIAEYEAKIEAERTQQHEKLFNTLRTCKRCKKKFKYGEMQHAKVSWDIGLYCVTCFDHFNREHTYTCPLCNMVYLSRRASKLCPTCRIKDEKKEARVLQRHLREARQEGRPTTLTLKQWLTTLHHFGGNCAYCQDQPYEVLEHFTPLSPGKENGGGTTVDNCVPACESCNRKKNNAHPDDILAEATIVTLTGLTGFHYGIDIKSIERVWVYLESVRQTAIPGWSLEERKQYYHTTVTQWFNEKKPEMRQKVMEILSDSNNSDTHESINLLRKRFYESYSVSDK